MEKKSTWKLVNPEGVVQTEKRLVNQHPRNLAGKTVVLYWNGKPNGDILLNRIGEMLTEKVHNIKVVKAWEAIPSTKQTDSSSDASKVTAEKLAELNPDIVIGAPGDCTGSATWLVIDQLNLEKLGVPTVTVLTSPYMMLGKTVPSSEGFGDTCLIEVPPPIGMIPPPAVSKRAEDIFPEILKAVTDWQPSSVAEAYKAAYPAETFEFTGNIEDINSYFLEKKWSLGLPILPPTPERVSEMLKGTSRKPEEVLGQVPPRMGTLTIELVAVCAVMAGCRPQYLPILIAALEGLLSPEAGWRMALTGTGASQVIVVVNGPVIKEIGIGCEQGAAGKGYHANGSIGYAINLIAYTTGGSKPPLIDRSTLASPADYVCWVFGENEEASPPGWEPLHVERGFRKSDSVVTVMVSYPPIENLDHWSVSGEEHLRWWSRIVSPLHNMGGPTVPQIMEQNPIIALGPEHAHFIASAGWSKDDFRTGFWEWTRIPLSVWSLSCGREKLTEKFGSVTEDTLIPMVLKPEQFLIIIAGGDGKQSHYFAPCPTSLPVSRLVKNGK